MAYAPGRDKGLVKSLSHPVILVIIARPRPRPRRRRHRKIKQNDGEARGRVVRALDCEAEGRRFESHSGQWLENSLCSPSSEMGT